MNQNKKQTTSPAFGIDRLEALIQESVSPYHTVRAVKKRLCDAGFEELKNGAPWSLAPGKKYAASPYGSCLIAFTIGVNAQPEHGFRIGAAHGDFPGFRIKPRPEMEKDGYLRLNAEGYGGVNHMSWLDRPLSLAGKIVLRSEDPFAPKVQLADFKHPLLTIPNVAVHLQRDMNKGMELKKQTQMLPLLGLSGETASEGMLSQLLAEQLSCDPKDILDYELNLYNAEPGSLLGIDNALYQAPRLDDLTSVQALMDGLLAADRARGINVLVIFDHEEVGSRTKQGAGSTLFTLTLEKIYRSLGWADTSYTDALNTSLMMSVDVAHALHPAYESHYDPVNKNRMGKGFSIKQACSQSYATDSEAIAIVQQICDAKEIPYQKFVNHSDERGGGTLGSIASALLPVRCVDIGIPILAMHSARETMGTADLKALTDYLTAFYTL
ncbi:MAG: M18 family aminopeptidase [Lachnospiraceae bacterium]|nr:M18 family aminopeptidase [bacterium]MDY5516371.1 M18 family aminopeptidase [Lachnospiraceae bacterium]